jgi:O-antigen ligase
MLVIAQRLSADNQLSVLTLAAVGLTLLTIPVGVLFPELAIHQPDDPQKSIVGAWRGIFYHKNLAGCTAGAAILLEAIRVRKSGLSGTHAAIIIALLSTLFVIGSRTAAASALIAIAALFITDRIRAPAGREREILASLAFGLTGLCLVMSAAVYFGLDDVLSDPAAFTGRVELWENLYGLIERRPFFGYGFESVFQTGGVSPLEQMRAASWVIEVSHSHNAVLDLLVNLGICGVVLFIVAFVYFPLKTAMTLPGRIASLWRPILVSMIAYLISYGVLEGRPLSGDSPLFIYFCFVMSLAIQLRSKYHSGQQAAPAMMRPPVSSY